jgi:hypothetical protein
MQYLQVVGAPAWADTEQYDVEAKAEKPSTRDEFREMLQTLLLPTWLKRGPDSKECPRRNRTGRHSPRY